MNIYNSIVPSEMTNREIQSMCTEIQTAKNWGLTEATVKLANGLEYKVPVSRHKDYQDAFQTDGGQIARGVGSCKARSKKQ